MPTIKLIGLVTDIFPPEFFTNFTKRVFWLEEPGTERYPQHWALELHNQDVDQIKNIKVGDRLECEVEIRGKKWKNKRNGEESIILALKCVGIRVIVKVEDKARYTNRPGPIQGEVPL